MVWLSCSVNQGLSMDFLTDALVSELRFRVLTVVDDHMREALE